MKFLNLKCIYACIVSLMYVCLKVSVNMGTGSPFAFAFAAETMAWQRVSLAGDVPTRFTHDMQVSVLVYVLCWFWNVVTIPFCAQLLALSAPRAVRTVSDLGDGYVQQQTCYMLEYLLFDVGSMHAQAYRWRRRHVCACDAITRNIRISYFV